MGGVGRNGQRPRAGPDVPEPTGSRGSSRACRGGSATRARGPWCVAPSPRRSALPSVSLPRQSDTIERRAPPARARHACRWADEADARSNPRSPRSPSPTRGPPATLPAVAGSPRTQRATIGIGDARAGRRLPSDALGHRSYRLSVLLTREDMRILDALADDWDCPVATAAYGLLADQLRRASKLAGSLPASKAIGIAGSLVAGIVTADDVAALARAVATRDADRSR